MHTRSHAHLTLNPNMTTVQLSQSFAYIQPQAHPLTRLRFGGVNLGKRLEQKQLGISKKQTYSLVSINTHLE